MSTGISRSVRVILEQDLKREYQEFLQEPNRNRPDSDGRPDRDEDEIRDWAREHNLPYFDGQVHFPEVLTLTKEGRDVLGAHTLDRDGQRPRRRSTLALVATASCDFCSPFL